MQFSLIDTTNNNLFIFPVNPNEVHFTSETKTHSLTSIVLGDISWGRGREVEEIDLGGIWPGHMQNIPRNHYLEPAKINELFKNTFDHRPTAKTLRLIITDPDHKVDINMLVNLTRYKSSYPYGDDTIKYDMTLKEARSFKVRRFTPSKNNAITVEKKRPAAQKPSTYTIKKGDTLSAITRSYLGTASKWQELYASNKGTLKGKSPHLIYPGEVLKIPEGWGK